jgi:hypothetical protein
MKPRDFDDASRPEAKMTDGSVIELTPRSESLSAGSGDEEKAEVKDQENYVKGILTHETVHIKNSHPILGWLNDAYEELAQENQNLKKENEALRKKNAELRRELVDRKGPPKSTPTVDLCGGSSDVDDVSEQEEAEDVMPSIERDSQQESPVSKPDGETVPEEQEGSSSDGESGCNDADMEGIAAEDFDYDMDEDRGAMAEDELEDAEQPEEDDDLFEEPDDMDDEQDHIDEKDEVFDG